MDKIVLKGQQSFVPSHILECGQCFRWEKLGEEHYSLINKDKYAEVIKKDEDIEIMTDKKEDEKLWREYFDLETDYELIKEKLYEDEMIREALVFGSGIRILRQDPFETYISFIISQNNQIKNIKNTISNIAKMYGEKKISFKGEEYYTFPGAEKLKDAHPEDIALYARAGYRSDKIVKAAQMVYDKEIDFNTLKEMRSEEASNTLMKVPGIGPKVAQCIVLFGLYKTDAFPVDVWVKRVMEEVYYKKDMPKKYIQEDGYRRFKEYSGYAQQYLFYFMREKNKKSSKKHRKKE